MSGFEVLGVLASTAQLAAYALKAASLFTELHERLKHAPERIEQHAHQITRLIEISRHIKDVPSLQTKLVFAQLIHTIEQACILRDLLQKVLGHYTQASLRRRYWKLLEGKKERQIVFALQSLEREKTVLTLCLTVAQNEALQDVRLEIKKTTSDMSNKPLPVVPGKQIVWTYPRSPSPSQADTSQFGDDDTRGETAITAPIAANSQSGDNDTQSQTAAEEMALWVMAKRL